MRKALRNTMAFAALSTMVMVAACERSPTGTPGHELLGTVEILDRSVTPNVVIATWTHDGGWDTDNLLTMSHSAEENRTRVSIGARMWNRGGDQIELSRDGEYGVRYGVVGTPTVIEMEDPLPGDERSVEAILFHGDHVHIYSDNVTRPTGTDQIVFALWHVDHADGETTPINITVTD